MPIQTNKTITYGELIDATVNYIESNCLNVGSNTLNPVGGYKNNSIPSNWNERNIGNNTTVTMKVADAILETNVPKSTVKDQLEDFLRGRNLYMLTDTEISHKSLINYVSNISTFICSRMVHLTNGFSTQTNGYLAYISANTITDNVTDITNLSVTKAEIEANTKSIVKVNSLTSNVHSMNMTISYNCSSSSSSCSSSSCSSSSSLFVAYMTI